MSATSRNRRIVRYAYAAVRTGGDFAPTYTLVASPAADGAWWAAIAVPTGRETTAGMQAEHVADAVIAVDESMPVARTDVLVDLDTSEIYKVTALLPRRAARELQVLATYADDATRQLIVAAAPTGIDTFVASPRSLTTGSTPPTPASLTIGGRSLTIGGRSLTAA